MSPNNPSFRELSFIKNQRSGMTFFSTVIANPIINYNVSNSVNGMKQSVHYLIKF